MISLGKWRWPILIMGCGAIFAGLFQSGAVGIIFESDALLAYKGRLLQVPRVKGARVERGGGAGVIRLVGEGVTPSAAREAAETASAFLANRSLEAKRGELRQKMSILKNRQAKLSTILSGLAQERQAAMKGSRRIFTPAMARRLVEARERHSALKAGWPTHTDILVLAREIKSLEAIRRGQVKIDPNRIAVLSKQIAEARAEWALVSIKANSLDSAEKKLRPDWTIVKAAATPRWPARVPGWPVASASAIAVAIMGFLLAGPRRRATQAPTSRPAPESDFKIPLQLASDEPDVLPDDPLSRKAASYYDRWLVLVKTVYAPGPEAPKNIYPQSEPLLKETVAFLGEGHDALTRHVARAVVPGDLCSHVARTVLMALIGAHEAGANAAQQQGMTFAALFHDLAVVPRPAETWHEIGSEIGRLSSGLLRKIPGMPPTLLALVEEILVAMDEYPMETWQNVPRNPEVASFAKLLRHIDHFDRSGTSMA